MNPHSGRMASTGAAHIGTFLRLFAAATYGGSGGGGGAAAGTGAAARAAGATAGFSTPADSSAAPLGASEAGAASPALSPPPRPMAARRSFERFSRCSGISVTNPRQSVQERCARWFRSASAGHSRAAIAPAAKRTPAERTTRRRPHDSTRAGSAGPAADMARVASKVIQERSALVVSLSEARAKPSEHRRPSRFRSNSHIVRSFTREVSPEWLPLSGHRSSPSR